MFYLIFSPPRQQGNSMNYDNSATALFHPELQAPLLTNNFPASEHALCAELSRLAYWHYEKGGNDLLEFNSIFANAGFDVPVPLTSASTDTQAYMVTKGNVAYIAFRGTQPSNIKDFLVDALVFPIEWEGAGRVHTGFLGSYNSIEKQLHNWLKPHKDRTIYFTGHSLGGALATLAAALVPGSNLVTFGSPRVGNQKFVEMFNGRTIYRYVNDADIVARVPTDFTSTRLGDYLLGTINYEHVSGLHFLDGKNKALTGAAAQAKFDEQSIPSASTFFLNDFTYDLTKVPIRALTDHAPINYLRAMLT
jgi:hypothetical protein